MITHRRAAELQVHFNEIHSYGFFREGMNGLNASNEIRSSNH